MSENATPGTPATRLRLCDFIRAHHRLILEEWERAVRLQPCAQGLSRPQLLDHMPELLERVANVVETLHTGEQRGLEDTPETHALHRLDAGFELQEVVGEYALLRTCVLRRYRQHLAAAGARDPVELLEEVERLHRTFDEAISSAIARFARARERTLVALDRMAEAALGSEDLDAFLPRFLRVLLETTEAVDSVSLLLREGNTLRARASVGLEEEVAACFTLQVGEGFSGTIAAERRPLELRAAASDPLVKSPFLRARGTRALYGVPLLHDEDVIGVAHMGSRTAFEFSREDKLLFRSMTSRATSFLIQARLAERLRHSDTRLHAIIDHAPAAIFIKDAQGRYVLTNRRLEALHQRPREALLGKTDAALMAPEVAEAFRANDVRVLQSGEPVTVEEEVPQEDGLHTWLSVKFPLPDAQGRPQGVCGISTDITERKQMEAALRESEERFRLLVEGVRGYALYMLDPQGRVMSWNPGAERLKGYRAEEIIGQPLSRFYTPEDVQAGMPERALRTATTEGRYEAEAIRVRKDGTRFWADVVLTPLRGRSGKLLGYAKVTRDISERKRTQEELRETGVRLKAILDTAVDSIITIDEHAIIQSVNPATTRLFGYTPEELVGQNIKLLMPQPDRRQHDTYMANYLRTGVRKVIGIGREVLGQRKDGSIFPLELAVGEARLPQGRLFTGMLRDISARKQAEEAQALLIEAGTLLAQSLDVPTTLRNLASLVVRHLADYCMVDLFGDDGQLHRLECLAGDPERQELINKALPYAPRLVPGNPFARVLETGQPLVSDITPEWLDSVARGAEHRAILDALAPRSSILVPLIARGRKLGLINLASREPGRMARPSTIELVRGVADRAAIAIDNARLYQEAQAAVRVREDVVAIVSHDLRNPLNAITLSAVALIKREDLDERTAKTVNRIYAAADRAHRLIRDLLDFTQARVGDIPLTRQPMDFHALARQVVEEVRSAHPERRITFASSGSGQGAWDPGRMAQVLANLLGNAIQHSPAATPVRVATCASGEDVLFEVHNEGTPIAAELLPTLFEPYRRGQEAGAGTGGSLGLGLFISRRIVEAHGGTIQVRSRAEDGTTFTVRLPRGPRAPHGA